MKIPSVEDIKYCPLCLKKWKIVDLDGKEGKAYFVCFDCEISIWVRDHMVGQWEKVEPVICGVCNNEKMRMFFRSDEFIKTYCPKCKSTVESYDEDKHRKINPDTKLGDIVI